MRQIVVNADDFGIHNAVNAAILQAHKEGILTSTTLLAPGEAFEEAVIMAKNTPSLGVGFHMALVGGLRPVAPIEQVRTLVTSEGRFRNSHVEFLSDWMRGRIDLTEVKTEIEAQWARIIQSGILPTHVDGHQHLHVLPGIFSILLDLMEREGVRYIRIPEEKALFANGTYSLGRAIGKWGLSLLAARARKVAIQRGVRSTDYFWGMMSGGHMHQSRLQQVLEQVARYPGTHEIMMHPGKNNETLGQRFCWGYQWESELEALTAPTIRDFLHEHECKLCHFGGFYE